MIAVPVMTEQGWKFRRSDVLSQYLLWINAESSCGVIVVIHVGDCHIVAAFLDGNNGVLL